jgi:hypothetical protein
MPKIMSSHLRLDVTLADVRYSPSQLAHEAVSDRRRLRSALTTSSGGDEAVSGFIPPRSWEKSSVPK